MSYQTILLVVQSLPRRWGTVNRFSAIIGAPFRGEARRSGVIVDAFNEFWASAYADVHELEGGWPAPIKAALQASRQGGEAPPTNQDYENLQATESGSRDEPGEIPLTTELDKWPSIIAVGLSAQPHPQGPTTPCKSPSTPRKDRRTHVSTPPRRRRTSLSPKTLHTFGPEPRSPLTDLRKKKVSPPLLYTSPTPKASDKENAGPSPKPLPDMFASVLGKRKMEPTIEDSTSYVKRKISSSRSLKTARTLVATKDTALEGETPTKTAGDGAVDTPSKKRKSEVFAGVVVPTLKEVMLRRRHSAPLKEMAGSQQSDASTSITPRKKIRTVRSGEPTTLMGDFPVAGSGKCAHLRLRNESGADHIDYLVG